MLLSNLKIMTKKNKNVLKNVRWIRTQIYHLNYRLYSISLQQYKMSLLLLTFDNLFDLLIESYNSLQFHSDPTPVNPFCVKDINPFEDWNYRPLKLRKTLSLRTDWASERRRSRSECTCLCRLILIRAICKSSVLPKMLKVLKHSPESTDIALCGQQKNILWFCNVNFRFHLTSFIRSSRREWCSVSQSVLNPFPNTPFWDHPKFKEAADDTWNVAIKGFSDIDCIENIVENVKLIILSNFTSPKMFSQGLFLQCVNMNIYGGKG